MWPGYCGPLPHWRTIPSADAESARRLAGYSDGELERVRTEGHRVRHALNGAGPHMAEGRREELTAAGLPGRDDPGVITRPRAAPMASKVRKAAFSSRCV